jgi:hypothetical protein
MVYGVHQIRGNYHWIYGQIAGFVKQKKRLPVSLDEVKAQFGDSERWNDPWGNPVQFRVRDDHWMLSSQGRDGKPGGTGFDADYTYNLTSPSDLQPTLWQFLSDPKFRDAGICPLLAALVMWVTLVRAPPRHLKGDPSGMLRLVLYAFVVGLAAIYGGVSLAALHIPNGH